MLDNNYAVMVKKRVSDLIRNYKPSMSDLSNRSGIPYNSLQAYASERVMIPAHRLGVICKFCQCSAGDILITNEDFADV